MARVRATPSSLAVLLWSLVALAPLGGAACHVGEAADDDVAADGDDDGDDGSTGPDASPDDGSGDDVTDDGADDGGDDGGAIDVTACRDLVTTGLPDGHHPDRFDYNDGEEKGCISAGCHDGSGGPLAPTYTAGGALYGDLTGGRPIGGATVYLSDGDGKVLALTTAENGFFWTTEPLTAPVKTAITAGCPDDPSPMLGAAPGNCNGGGGCHNQSRQIYPL